MTRQRLSDPERYQQDFSYRSGAHIQGIWDSFARLSENQSWARSELERSRMLLEYAQAAGTGSLDPKLADTRFAEEIFYNLKKHTHQLEGRFLAAALTLRQGKPVPARGTVTVDSWFFDPVTRQPARFYQSPAGPGIVRLHLVWPIHPEKEDARILRGSNDDRRMYHLPVLLPASHPGLQSVPRLEPRKTEERR